MAKSAKKKAKGARKTVAAAPDTAAARDKALDAAVKQIEQNFGAGSIM